MFSRYIEYLRWPLMSFSRKNRLTMFKGVHDGARCFVVGNGPSLNRIDMSLVRDEITLGSNRVYLGFDKWGFHFKYWLVIDELQIIQSADEYVRKLPYEIIKFIPLQLLKKFDLSKLSKYYPINICYKPDPFPQFSNDPKQIYEGWSVTYALLQISVIMGCNPIYLIGVDYDYKISEGEKVSATRWTDAESRSHFIPNYCNADKGHVWNMPRFDLTDQAFKCAAEWCEKEGVQVFNATPGSKLSFFPRIEYENIF